MFLFRTTNIRLMTALFRAQSTTSNNIRDVVVVGGGIVGLASSQALLTKYPNLNVTVLEKESQLASHQTGHNSGVIHAGIYYQPGTLKAKLCVEGMEKIYDYCDKYSVPYKKCGKIVVAIDEHQIPYLTQLYERSLENKVKDVKLINGNDIPEIEPMCRGLKAIHSPHTGIIDYAELSRQFGVVIKEKNGQILPNTKGIGFGTDCEGNVVILTNNEEYREIRSRFVVTCCGLHSDKISVLGGCKSNPKIIPFRGDYLVLSKEKQHLIKGNIYPVPDPRFPFLGVHFTPRMNGDVWAGPNAVLAMKREGYKPTDFVFKDALEHVFNTGLRKLSMKFLGVGLKEIYRTLDISATVKILQQFVPDVETKDFQRGPSGVRAQAIDTDGSLVDDFIFDTNSNKPDLKGKILHVRNAPSPAATSSLAIADMVVDEMERQFHLKEI